VHQPSHRLLEYQAPAVRATSAAAPILVPGAGVGKGRVGPPGGLSVALSEGQANGLARAAGGEKLHGAGWCRAALLPALLADEGRSRPSDVSHPPGPCR
jgi:hypothetical protein